MRILAILCIIIGILGIISYPYTLKIDKIPTDICVREIKKYFTDKNINDESMKRNLRWINSNNTSFKLYHYKRGNIILTLSSILIIVGFIVLLLRYKLIKFQNNIYKSGKQ